MARRLALAVILPKGSDEYPERFGGGYVRFSLIVGHLSRRVNIIKLEYSQRFLQTLSSILASLKNLGIIRRGSPVAIVSVNPAPPDILTGSLLSRMTGIAHVVFVNSVPLYGYAGYGLISHKKSSLPHIWSFIRASRRPLFPALVETLIYYELFRCLRRAVCIPLTPDIAESLDRMGYTLVSRTLGIGCLRAQLPASGKKLDAVYIASPLHPDKGLYDVLEIWEAVVKEIPSMRLLIAGKEAPFFDMGMLKENVRCRGLEGNVIVFSRKYGVPKRYILKLLSRAKLLLYPTLKDQTPLIISEALSCGTPVVTYDLPGIRYAYGDCPAVIRVKPGNKQLAAKEILNLLSNPIRFEKLRITALAWCRNNSWKKVAAETLKAYLYAALTDYRTRIKRNAGI